MKLNRKTLPELEPNTRRISSKLPALNKELAFDQNDLEIQTTSALRPFENKVAIDFSVPLPTNHVQIEEYRTKDPFLTQPPPEVILEFKVDGMTCVNCSRTIENAMNGEYGSKGLISVQIALLTHKMRIVFNLSLY